MKQIFATLIPSSAGVRFPALDGLRGLACLAVILSHLQLIPVNMSFHHLAVTVFFSLSAFLAYQSYLKRPQLNAFDYYKKKVLRIYPAYIIALVFSFIVAYYVGKDYSAGNLFTHLFFIHTFTQWHIGNNDALWFMAPLFHFYLLFPFLAWTATRFRWFFMLTLPCAIVLQFFFSKPGAWNPAINFPYLALPFLCGMLSANIRNKSQRNIPLLAITSAIFLCLYAVFYKSCAAFLAPIPPSILAVRGLLPSVFAAILVHGIAAQNYRALSIAPLRWMSSISYSVFLTHVPVYYLIKHLFGWHLCQIIGIPLALAVGVTLWCIAESPMSLSPYLQRLLQRVGRDGHACLEGQDSLRLRDATQRPQKTHISPIISWLDFLARERVSEGFHANRRGSREDSRQEGFEQGLADGLAFEQKEAGDQRQG